MLLIKQYFYFVKLHNESILISKSLYNKIYLLYMLLYFPEFSPQAFLFPYCQHLTTSLEIFVTAACTQINIKSTLINTTLQKNAENPLNAYSNKIKYDC